MAEIVLRPARKTDAADLAILDNLAGFGLSHWFWQQVSAVNSVEDAYACGRQRLADANMINGWSNSTVATENEIILGMSSCYIVPDPSEEESDDSASLKRLAPAFAPVFELHDEAIGHWFIDCLAVYPEARGKGVGALLMDDYISRASNSGADFMSLIVEDANAHAMRLYEARGFRKSASRPYVEFDGPAKSKEWLLLTAEL